MANTLGDLAIRVGFDVAGLTDGVGQIGGILDGVSAKIENAFGGLDSAGSSLKSLGVNITELIAPLAGMEGAAFAAGEAMENAMNTIIRSTGAVGESLDSLKGSFDTVFGSVAVSSADAAQAISKLSVILGETGEPLEVLTEALVRFSKFTGTDLQSNVENVARLFNDWKISTDDQALSLDKLFTVFQKTGTSVTTLESTLTTFGATFRQLGLSIDDASVLVGKLGQTTGNADAILTGFKKTVSTLAKAGEDVPTAFASIIEAIKNETDATVALQLATAAFGPRGVAPLVDAIQSGKVALQDFTGVLIGADGAIQRAADATPTLTAALTLLKNNVTLALAPLGETLVTAFTGWVKDIDPLVQELATLGRAFNDLSPLAKQFAVDIAGLGIATAGGLVGLGLAAAAIGKIGEVAVVVVGALEQISTVVYAVGAGMTEALLPAEAAILAVGEALTGIGILAVGAYAGFQAFGELKDTFVELSDQMTTTEQVVSDFVGRFVDFKDLKDLVSGLGDSFSELIQPVADAFEKLTDALGITGDLAAAWKTLTGALGDMTWWSVLAAPITLLKQDLQDLKDALVLLTGRSAEMDKATQQMSAGLQDFATNLNHSVAEMALAGDASERINLTFRDLSTVVGMTLPASFEAAAKSSDYWLDALGKQSDGAQKAADANAKLDAIIEASQEKLQALAVGFDDFWNKAFLGNEQIILNLATTFANSLQSMHDEATKQIPSTIAILDLIPGGFGTVVEMVKSQIVELNKAFATVGVETDASEAAKIKAVQDQNALIQQAYLEGWTDLQGKQLVSQQAALNSQIAADQFSLNEAHKHNQAISDDLVHSLDSMKAAAQAGALDIDQAFSAIGSKSTAQITDQLTIVDAAYKKIAGDATSSLGDMQRAQLADLQTMVAAIQSSGQAVSTSLLNQISTLQDRIKSGNAGLLADFDAMAGAIGTDFQKASDTAIVNFMTGQGSLGQAWSGFLTSLATDFEKIFLQPITKGIATFISGSLSNLIGGQGLAGVTNQANLLGASLQKAFGLGTKAAATFNKTIAGSAGSVGSAGSAFSNGNTSSLSGSGEVSTEGNNLPGGFANDSSGEIGLNNGNIGTGSGEGGIEGSGLPGGTSGDFGGETTIGGGSSSFDGFGAVADTGLSSLSGLAGIGSIVSAIAAIGSGITQGIQGEHMNNLLDEIEKSTRGALNVLATNGTDSILHYTAATSQYTMDTRDRVTDIRAALFDPVAKDLEAIWTELNGVVLPVLQQIGNTNNTIAASGGDVTQSLATVVSAVGQAGSDTTAAVLDTAAINSDNMSNLSADLAQSNATATSEAATTYGAATQDLGAAITSSGDQVAGTVAAGSNQITDAVGGAAAGTQASLTALGSSYDALKATLIGKAMSPDPSDVALNAPANLSGVVGADDTSNLGKWMTGEPAGYNPAGSYIPPVPTTDYSGPAGGNTTGFTTHTGPMTGTPVLGPVGTGSGPATVGFSGGGAFTMNPVTGTPIPPVPTTGYTGAVGGSSMPFVGGGPFNTPSYTPLPSPYASAPPTPAPPPGANQYGEVNPYENDYGNGVAVQKNTGPVPANITLQITNPIFSNQSAFEQFNSQLAQTLQQNIPG